MKKLTHMFTPLTVKNLTIPNRFAVAPMVTNYCNGDGTATERFIRYQENKAQGGFGLIITEDYAVSPQGRGFVNVAGLWNDGQISGHSALPPRVQKHGAKIFAQIYHCGRQTSAAVIGQRQEAPSPVLDPFNSEIPRELSIEEIEKITDQFGDCALRAKQCGFDGIEVHGAHGYLLSGFMSLYSNKRTDEYGGSLMNRLRFPLAVLKNIREKVGDDFIIDFRISADELVSGGRTIEDTKAIVPRLVDAGIDMVHVSVGVYYSNHEFVPPHYVRHGFLADMAKEIKAAVDIPVVSVGRINDPFLAEELIASGKMDMAAFGRGSLADPALPLKAKEGRYDDIRQCIGCNYGCVGFLFENKPITCVVNPGIGLEYQHPTEKTKTPKKLVVIGGGPGGVQAAISAAELGHKATLYEKDAVLGGQFRIAAIPPAKGELTPFLAWQRARLEKLGVDVKLEAEATAASIGKPDAVILATGAKPIVPNIPGATKPHVVTTTEILLGRAFPGNKVVVIGGGQAGAETADFLANIGRKVVIIEMLKEIAPLEARSARIFLLRALKEAEVEIHTETVVKEITDTEVVSSCGTRFEADTVVLAVGVRSENTLETSLKSAGFPVQVIGDAVSGRNVHNATKEAYEAALALQSTI